MSQGRIEQLAKQLSKAHSLPEDQALSAAQDWVDQSASLEGYWKLEEKDRLTLRSLFVNGWMAGYLCKVTSRLALN